MTVLSPPRRGTGASKWVSLTTITYVSYPSGHAATLGLCLSDEMTLPQYELDGSTEAHDPSEPSTSSCPYLPGQTVNTLFVPVERPLRHRSASLSSMCEDSFQTLNPDARFNTPRPTSPPLSPTLDRRVGTAPSLSSDRPPSRLSSSVPSWRRFLARRFLGKDGQMATLWPLQTSLLPSERKCCPVVSEEGPDKDFLLPRTLRRVLFGNPAMDPSPETTSAPIWAIPEDEYEDVNDDGLADPRSTEHSIHNRHLSSLPKSKPLAAPGPGQQTASTKNGLFVQPASANMKVAEASSWPHFGKSDANSPACWSSSATSSVVTIPTSPQWPDEESPCCCYDSNDDDEVFSLNDGDTSHQPFHLLPSATEAAFKGYSLPQQGGDEKAVTQANSHVTELNSPRLLDRGDANLAVGGNSMLGATIDSGLEDFVHELGCIVSIISNR